MRKRLFYWELAGFLWTAVIGTLSHYVYEWSGGSGAAAVLGAVNESVWEHMKLLVMPVLLFTAAQVWALGEVYPNVPAVRAVSVLFGAVLIPVLYYTYTGALGIHEVWIDISIFYVSAAAAFLLDHRLIRTGYPTSPWAQLLGAAVLIAVAFAFILCTFSPPEFPLWQDPVTGRFGR